MIVQAAPRRISARIAGRHDGTFDYFPVHGDDMKPETFT
jgi:hypothetical protein